MVLALSLTLALGGCFSDLSPSAYAWEDTDCNSQPGPTEKPLQGVCIWRGSRASDPLPPGYDCTDRSNQTGYDGIWFTEQYFSSCDQIYVFAVIPDGYQPTTDTAVHACGGSFGFAKTGACPAVQVVGQAGLATLEAARQTKIRIIEFLCLAALILAGGWFVKMKWSR